MCKGVGGGIFNFLMATDTAAEQAKVNKAKVQARNAKNERSAAESGLARFNQSLANKKILDKAGKAYATLSENLNRRIDAYTLNSAMGSMRVSEELGATTAAAAAAGVGGSSVEQYNRTIETAYGLQKEAQDRQVRSDIYLSSEQMGSTITDAVDAMGRNVYNAERDFTYYGPTKGPSLLGNLATLAVAAGATAAGAPQVGEAILRAKTASMQNRSGDGAGATKSFGQALDSFKLGVGEIRDMFRTTPQGGSGAALFGGGINPSYRPSLPSSVGSISFR